MPSPRFDEAAVDTPPRVRLVDEAIEHYVAWREECAAVRAGYEYWSHESGADRMMWFAAYKAALDREECAAELYALSVRRLGRFLWPGSEP